MPDCPRCLKTFKNLARHSARKTPCKVVARAVRGAADPPVGAPADPPVAADPVAPADPVGAAPELLVPESSQALTRAVFEARNIIRGHGVTGMEAVDCIVTLFALRAVEIKYPRIADPETFELPARIRVGAAGVAGGGVSSEARTAVSTGHTSFRKIVSSANDPGTGIEWSNMIRGALESLKFHPDTKQACKPLYADFSKMFPLNDSKAAHRLAVHINDNIQICHLGQFFYRIEIRLIVSQKNTAKGCHQQLVSVI
jgi:hypothetical protein